MRRTNYRRQNGQKNGFYHRNLQLIVKVNGNANAGLNGPKRKIVRFIKSRGDLAAKQISLLMPDHLQMEKSAITWVIKAF